MIKEDMWNAIIGDEYIEDPDERKAKMQKLSKAAVEDASVEIDGYLAKRYHVPVKNPPGILKKLAKDIAAYNLVSRMGVDESERDKTFLTRYEQAISFLLNVAKGIIDLDTTGGGASEDLAGSEALADGFRMRSEERVFSRTSMKGW